MKNKVFKLFLVFGVIILSLFVFASCETLPDNEEEVKKKPYLSEIKDSEYIEFVLGNLEGYQAFHDIAPGLSSSGLYDLYTESLVNEDIEIREYISAGQTKLIAGYLPKESIELIFETNTDSYLEKVNGSTVYKLKTYLSDNKLSYRDVGFKLYYVDEKSLSPSFDEQFIVYVGEESFISDNSNNVTRIIKNVGPIRIKDKIEIRIHRLNGKLFPLSIRFLSTKKYKKFETRIYGSCRILKNNDGVDIVKESDLYIQKKQNKEEFLKAFSSAELYVEKENDNNGEEYISYRVYDYEKVKEILNIK